MTLIKDILYGMAVGDALGVPYEFKSREEMKLNPCTDMIGYGTWQQSKGTWSDDTSLALATVASLCNGYNINNIANNFVRWRDEGLWAVNHKVFDIGNTTNESIERIKEGKLPVTLCGGYSDQSNGNGSLMRILPILDYIIHLETKTIIGNNEKRKITSDLSSITHRHNISIDSCIFLIYFSEFLYITKNKKASFRALNDYLFIINDEKPFSNSILSYEHDEFINLQEFNIKSGGYVLDTLEASIWCLLTTDNYKDAVLKAVNLGGDTDTTACVTGGLAGILYGYDSIPKEWIEGLRDESMIGALIENYEKSKNK